MMGIGSVMGQSLNGTWKANQEFKNMFELDDDDGTDIDILLVFNASDMTIKLLITSQDDEVGEIKMSYTIPGTYKKNKDTYTASFNKEKAIFKVDDLTTNDPEMKELLTDPDSKKMILTMVETMVKKESSKDFEDMLAISEVFEKFEVASVTTKKMELMIDDTMKFGFDRQVIQNNNKTK